MRGGGGQQGGQVGSTYNFFWYMLAFVLAIMLVWFFFKPYIIMSVFFLRHYEMAFLNMLFSVWNSIVGFLHLTSLEIHPSTFPLWKKVIAEANVNSINFKQVSLLSRDVGVWLRYPILLVLGGLAFILYFFHKNSRYRQTYTMKSLRKLVHSTWPEITPIMGTNLVKQPLMKGPWAMAETPLEFCKKHNLLTTKINKNGKTVWQLIKAPSHRLFVMQLGQLWQDPFKLPIHIQALIVIFSACAQKDRKIANQLLDQIAHSADASGGGGRLDFTGVTALLSKYCNGKALRWAVQRHAYVGTVMATLLEIARTDGVLATAEFLWLKPVDRKLWYMLSNVGRQTAVVEVSGLFAHWLAEKTFKCPLKAPMVKEAVTGLEKAIEDTLYIQEQEKSWQYESQEEA